VNAIQFGRLGIGFEFDFLKLKSWKTLEKSHIYEELSTDNICEISV